MSENDCPYGDESLVVADYLAGRLSVEQSRAFEAHSFECERCFDELQLATELRGASEKRAAPESRPGVSRTVWPALGLAAALVLAIGVWFALPFPEGPGMPAEPVYRDGDAATDLLQNLPLEVGRDNGTVSLSWATVKGAHRYTVRVFTEAGDPVLEEQTTNTAIDLPAAAWEEAARPGQAYVQVIALDELRQMIVQSEFVLL